MKKTLFAMMTMVAMTACNSDELIYTAEHKSAITFSNAFVDNSIRAIDGSYNNGGNFSSFEVYGTITNKANESANIFKQELVQKGLAEGTGSTWKYAAANTQYWIPGNTYNFSAIADGNIEGVTSVTLGAHHMPTAIQLLDASQQKDLLFDASEPIRYESGSQTVSFTFKHLLAKVRFTVKNTITTNNGYSYKVSNLIIKDAAKNGVYTIANETWSEANEPAVYDIEFGHAVAADANSVITKSTNIAYNSNMISNYERLLIPANKSLLVHFDYQLLKDGLVIDTQHKQLITPIINLVAGQAYNFNIKLGNPGEPILFDVDKVEDWKEENKDI